MNEANSFLVKFLGSLTSLQLGHLNYPSLSLCQFSLQDVHTTAVSHFEQIYGLYPKKLQMIQIYSLYNYFPLKWFSLLCKKCSCCFNFVFEFFVEIWTFFQMASLMSQKWSCFLASYSISIYYIFWQKYIKSGGSG